MDTRTQVIYEEGIKLYKGKKFEMAASIFVKLSTNQKNNSSIHFFAGVSLFMIKKYNLSVSFFKKVIDLNKNYQQTMKSCVFLGYIYIEKHKYQEAFDVLQLPVEANFNDPYAYSLMGHLEHRNKKYQEADLYFKKSLEANPESSLFNNNYGYNLLVWKKDFDVAIPYLKKSIQIKKTSANLHSLGWAFYLQKNYIEAEKQLNLALKIKKDKSFLIKKDLELVKKKIKHMK